MNNTTIEQLLRQGRTYKEITALTGKCKATISYRAKKLNKGQTVNPKFAVRYDWKEIAEYAKDHTRKECMKKFGFGEASWTKSAKAGRVLRKSTEIPLEKIAVKNSTYHRGSLKARIIKENLIPYICRCGNTGKWKGKKLVLQLEHKNGIHNDHRFSNLEFLCPNCHSQTETFAGKTKQYKRPVGE